MPSLARREREALCDLALELGPDSPTLASWRTVEELVAHLLVVERHPYGASGLVLPQWAGATRKSRASERARGFPAMVDRLRDPGITPYLLFNARMLTALDLVVAHEDLRRVDPDWKPRKLSDADDDELWRRVTRAARRLKREVGVPADMPVVLERSDPPKSRRTIRRGRDPVVIKAKPLELVYCLHGRRQHYNVSIKGPQWQLDRIREADILTLRFPRRS